jgi:uncharacterized Zn finger protein
MAKTGTHLAARFDLDALKRLAGDAVFDRGAGYARQGRVRILSMERGKAHAQVTGSEVYRTTIEGGGRRIAGACDCPAFEDRGFCKHLVALALTVDAMEPAEIAEATDRADRLRAHLARQPADALADRLLHLAQRDTALRRELEMELELHEAPDAALLRRLCDEIDQAMATDGVVDWRGAASLADELGSVLDQVKAASAAGRPTVALSAVSHLLEGAEDLLNEVDDSDGEVYAQIEQAIGLHLDVCRTLHPESVPLARELFERRAESEFDFWSRAHLDYAEVLGAVGLAEYRRLAQEALRNGATDKDRDSARSVLDDFAMADGNVDARIALRAPMAASARDYLELAEICLGARREREALAWVEEGLWKCEDRPDRRLTILAADIYRSVGDPAKAEALLWKAFEREPSLDLHRLVKQTAADSSAAIERSTAMVWARAEKDRSPWSGARALLVELLMEEGRLAQAWEAVRAFGCPDFALERLARASEASHPREAIDTYVGLIERNVQRTNNEAYASACRLLTRTARLRANLGEQAEQSRHVLELRERHKAKRNFIRLLEDPTSWSER